MQAHIRREATRPSSRVPTSPRSRSAESVAVRKVREKPDLHLKESSQAMPGSLLQIIRDRRSQGPLRSQAAGSYYGFACADMRYAMTKDGCKGHLYYLVDIRFYDSFLQGIFTITVVLMLYPLKGKMHRILLSGLLSI